MQTNFTKNNLAPDYFPVVLSLIILGLMTACTAESTSTHTNSSHDPVPEETPTPTQAPRQDHSHANLPPLGVWAIPSPSALSSPNQFADVAAQDLTDLLVEKPVMCSKPCFTLIFKAFQSQF
jgi:hypothetical protein